MYTPGIKDGPTEKTELDTNVSLRKKYVNSTLLNKICNKCKKEFPRNDQYFYIEKKRGSTTYSNYRSQCIGCVNETSKKYKSRPNYQKIKRERDIAYKETERGYFIEMWQNVKKSKHGCEFKNYDEFFNCWVEQQKTYGIRCPYLNVEMTRKKGKGVKTDTNISKDRISSSLPYSELNLMFCSWKANNMKGSVTPNIAKRYLGFYNERFGNEY